MEVLILMHIFFLPSILMYEQDKYSIKFERGELVRFNPSLVSEAKLVSFKYNRTQAAVNSTIGYKIDVGNELEIEIQAYKFASNEYRVFPLRFQFNFCSFAKRNEFGLHKFFEQGNMTCPTRKGLYHIYNWIPTERRYPPLIPSGSYMIDIKKIYHDRELVFMRAYGTIAYPCC